MDETLAEIDARLARLHENIEADLKWFGEGAADEMKETHTFQNRTYRLESSITYTVYYFRGGVARVVVEAGMWYASLVENGHPGPPPARPYPFFWPVWWKWEPMLWPQLQTTVEETLGGRR